MNMKNNKFKNFILRLSNSLQNSLFPENIKCIFCGNDIPNFENQPYCKECKKDIPFNNGLGCLICDEPINNEATICDYCQKNKRFFKQAFCPFIYDGVVRNAILGYKNSNHRYKAKTFARFIVDRIKERSVKIDFVTYTPLTKKKEKKRSFNQSKLLANEISKILNIEVVNCFKKVKDTPPQKFSSYKERQLYMIGAYRLLPTQLCKDKNYLIVDDVITTCSTINSCSQLLYKKVDNVFVCSIARNKSPLQK